MRAIFMGKHKRSAVAALEYLVQRDLEVLAVVAPDDPGDATAQQRLDLAAERHGLKLASDGDLYDGAVSLDGVDLVLSFLFWKRIRRPLIGAGRIGCLNFHPAPLPDMRGLGGYNVAILEDFAEWGVSAHFVDEGFDTGDLVRVERFGIDREHETALSLDIRSQERLLGVFREVIDMALTGVALPRRPQGEGRYVTREEFDRLRVIDLSEPPEVTERRIRAYWYPPYDGATLGPGGLTVANRDVLEQTAQANRRAGLVP
ncbi:MAG: formyltransferase family protein [Thermoleophilaceae bacterium]